MTSSRRLMWSIVGLLAMFVIACAFLINLILSDPERFRPILSDEIEAVTGYRVEFAELSWQWVPNIAITVNGLTVQGSRGDSPLLSVDAVFIAIELLPLLVDQELKVEAVTLGEVSINLHTDIEGRTNYTASTVAGGAQPNSQGESAMLLGTLSQLEIAKLQIDYRDLSTNTDIGLVIDTLSGRLSNQALSILFDSPTTYIDRDLGVNFSGLLVGEQRIVLSQQTVEFDGFRIQGRLSTPQIAKAPFESQLSGSYFIQEDSLQLDQAASIYLGLETTFEGQIKELTTEAYTFDLSAKSVLTDSDQFNRLLKIPTLGLNPITAFKLETTITGTDLAPSFSALEGTANGTRFSGTADLSSHDQALNLDLRIDEIDLKQLVRSSDATTSNQNPTVAEERLIPIETLEGFNLDLRINIETLRLESFALTDLNFVFTNGKGVAEGKANARIDDGRLNVYLKSHYEQQSETQLKLVSQHLDLNSIWANQTLGHLSFDSALTFNGTTLGDFAHSLKGSSQFSLRDGAVDLRPAKSALQAIDRLTGTSSGVEAWPDVLNFDVVEGEHRFTQGLAAGQTARLGYPPITLTADGGFDIFEETFAFDTSLSIAPNSTNKLRLQGPLTEVPWPARCEGIFADAAITDCRLDQQQTSTLVKALMKQKLEERGRDLLKRSLKEKAPDRLKDLFNGLLGS